MENMRKIVLFLAVFFAGFSVLAQGAFERGNEAYRKGDFEAAVASYESILKGKKESADLYFNLGNAYYKLNKVAPAIYNYEKALLLDPGNDEVKTNLKFAQKLQIDDVKEVPKVGFGKMVEDYTSSLGVDGWAWMGVITAFVILGFFCGYYFSGSTLVKRIFFIGIFVGIFWLCASLFAAAFEKRRLSQERPAIVFAAQSGVRSEPQANAQDAFVLHEGTKVQILEKLDDWAKIELADGNKGWIRQADIKELK